MANEALLKRIEAAKRAVVAQTALLHAEFGRAESRWKSDGTRVTAIDVAISENIFRELGAQFSGDQFFSEELAETDAAIPVTSTYSWVLDPIDGTNNFALGIPHCAISLALCERGEPVYGVVYDLSRRVLMHGGPGFGMHDGDRVVSVLNVAPHRESIVGFHRPFDPALLPSANAVLTQFKIRGLGSATLHLAYVAAGLFDGCVDFNVKIWDLAAAIALVRASGGEVTFINGAQLPMRSFDLKMGRIVYVAGGPIVAARLRELVKI
ncbi:MAG: inositol monophosphatase [Opitutaceae bacterium]|jgi:myo-inositol-1(or 4)-monophosphatase